MKNQDRQADAPEHDNVPDESLVVDVVVLLLLQVTIRVLPDWNPEIKPPVVSWRG